MRETLSTFVKKNEDLIQTDHLVVKNVFICIKFVILFKIHVEVH
jgi:hypothetical protein